MPREELPEPPDWISPEVHEVWDRTVAELSLLGLAKCPDRDALVVYCQAVVFHARASQLLETSGLLIKSREGNPIKNPAAQLVRDNAQIIRVMAREFGLTPSARTGLTIERGSDDAKRGAARLLG